ncbi:MAG: protein kinase [Alphaproteobacteria bacterium]|nr:protein kinase [Alphaproteobacteria bacterium]
MPPQADEDGIPLGPFQLIRPVGKGGMGVVWLGRHREQGVEVAVKVITSKGAATDEYHQAFAQEVRAVSALDHPGIVWIFDSGEIDAATAAASNGELVAGSPYLVMEYASGGTLRQVEEQLDWPTTRQVLFALLDAMAHAHARGVLHRDLKPDNVLIAGPTDLRPGFKLSDFGIACPLDEDSVTEERPIGTPQYMAPEQIRNEVDLYGPHTDLYAFGGLAWKLVTGDLPFGAFKGASLMFAQLRKNPPAFVPRWPVPEGLETFLRILLAKDPRERFQRASDAAVALSVLERAGSGPSIVVGTGPDGLDTSTLRVVLDENTTSGEAITPLLRPPLPTTWRLPEGHAVPLRLMGAGLGLFGLRPVPFVGRDRERDLLWSALSEVHASGRAAAVVVRGGAGVGRTRLVHWIADRAHEVGGANVIDTRFVNGSTVLEHLRRPLVRFLRAHPLPPELRDQRFGELLAGLQLDRITVADAVEMLLDPERLELAEVQRFAIIRRVWEILAQDRPLLLLFDDVHLAPEALKLVRHLLDAQTGRGSPILVVMTAWEEELPPEAEATRALQGLQERSDTRRIDVGTLRGDLRTDLVRELLGLDEQLTARVAERTGGNPLFAVQLVADWVQRQVLRPGPKGFVLAEAGAEVPRSLSEVWESRIREVVRGVDAPALQLLERAAVLGQEVDVFEWQAVGDDPGGEHAAAGATYFNPRLARVRQAVMDRLLATRLAENSERGFVFTHALFRRALIDRAGSVGRLKGHALCCAAVLEHRTSDAEAERIAEWWTLGGRPAEAVPLLMRAETFHRRASGPARAMSALHACERALKAAGVPRGDRRWAELAVRHAELAQEAGHLSTAIKSAQLAHRLAVAGGWSDLDATSSMVLGATAHARGDDRAAERHWLAAVQRLGPEGPPGELIRAWHQLRRLAVSRKDRAEARVRGQEVAHALARARTESERAAGLLAVAEHHLWVDEHELAAERAQQAADLASSLRDLAANARAHAILAEVAERRGDMVIAREEWTLTVDLFEDLAHARRAALARCRLSLVESRMGRYTAARGTVQGVVPIDERVAAAVDACLAVTSAGKTRWDEVDRCLAEVERALPSVGPHAPELSMALNLLGTMAADRRHWERARRAWTTARDRLVAEGDVEGAAELARRLDALPVPTGG